MQELAPALPANLLIFGASARAAAGSALRAGLRPWCVDLFADVDLQQHGTVIRLRQGYPQGFRRFLESAPPGPWMYTGGLENHPRLVQQMVQQRPLWGNPATALVRCRDPKYVAAVLQSAGIAVPALIDAAQKSLPIGRWLLKPRKGAGGNGIRFWTPKDHYWDKNNIYCQEFIEGQALSLLFLGDGQTAHLLGITRQLVGENWLHAAPFRYCGSIGPVPCDSVQRPSLEQLGCLLASKCLLKGLFGIDGIVRDGTFWPVEINPRYTASVEVLEQALGVPMLRFHAHVFTHGRLPPLPAPQAASSRIIGKAILFARTALHFPADGPWIAQLRSPSSVTELPAFADIPAPGERIEAGKPILTFFAVADSPSACEAALRQLATDLDRCLEKR